MSHDTTAAAGAAEKLVLFPAERMLFARVQRDEVAVTHQGETLIYDCPEALHRAVRDADTELQTKLYKAHVAERRARRQGDRARLREVLARAERRRVHALFENQALRSVDLFLSGVFVGVVGVVGLLAIGRVF